MAETFSFSLNRTLSEPEAPNRIVRPQGASLWLLEFSTQGEGVLRKDAQSDWIRSRKGHCFLYQPHVPQYYELAPDADAWEHCWVVFEPRPHWQSWLKWGELFPGLSSLQVSDPRVFDQLNELFDAMLADYGSHHLQRREFAYNTLERFLLLAQTQAPAYPLAKVDARLRESLNFMGEHFAEKIGIEELARVAGLSPSRYSHLFREQMEMTPLQYLEKHRMEIARERLVLSGDSISEVAWAVGYDNPLYFSTLFRKNEGMSPREYRKRWA